MILEYSIANCHVNFNFCILVAQSSAGGTGAKKGLFQGSKTSPRKADDKKPTPGAINEDSNFSQPSMPDSNTQGSLLLKINIKILCVLSCNNQ